MISRRQMFQMAGALGAMSVLPQSLAAKPFLTVPDHDIGDRVDGTSLNDTLDFLETVEDLEDELDCVELIGRYSKLVRDPSDPTSVWADWPGGHCPFCGFADCRVAVSLRGFSAPCFHQGGGVAWTSLVEGIPLLESVQRLRGMLDRGDLVGMRKRIETQRAIHESLAAICHDALLNHSGRTIPRGSVNELTEETILHNQIGQLSVAMLSSFKAELLQSGWSRSELRSAGVIGRSSLARLPRDWAALVMPVRDDRKRVLGFAHLILPGPDRLLLIPTYVLSSLGWDRLVIRSSRTALGIQGAWPLLLTSAPLDAVLLWQQGFASAVAPVRHWGERNLRRMRALNAKLIYVASVEFFRSDDFMSLLSLLGNDAARLSIVELPNGLAVADYLRKHGGQALRARLDSAVPAAQVLKA